MKKATRQLNVFLMSLMLMFSFGINAFAEETVKISNALNKNNYKSKIVSQIHDELIIKVHEDEKQVIEELVRDIMENVYEFDCPLKVDGQISKTWYEVK